MTEELNKDWRYWYTQAMSERVQRVELQRKIIEMPHDEFTKIWRRQRMMNAEEQREMDRLKAVNEGLRKEIGQMEAEISKKNELIDRINSQCLELHVTIEQLLLKLIQR